MINNANKDNLFSKIPLDCICNIADYSNLETTLNLRLVSKKVYELMETYHSSRVWEEKGKQYGYFKNEENLKANAFIGFKLAKIITLPYEEKLQKIFGVIRLLDYFELNKFIERTDTIVSDVFSASREMRLRSIFCDAMATQTKVFLAIVEEYRKIGNFEKVEKLLEKALEKAEKISDSNILDKSSKDFYKSTILKSMKLVKNILEK